MPAPVLAVHGGAGSGPPPERRDAWARRVEGGIRRALLAGQRVLRAGGPALEACVSAVEVLEDLEDFNAGIGSVLTLDGRVEMDAAVMNGADGAAGGVATVSRLAHPVRAAVAVMRHSPHVLIAGVGAEELALAHGCAPIDPDRLVTEARRQQLERVRARAPGTVGAVARDAEGHLAAATSTGGLAGKLPGRVSDSCQIGAGTWAADDTCAVSATGQGELFVRCAFAHLVDARLRFGGENLAAACEAALARVRELGGRGGCIAVDASGALALPFLTAAMPRGWVDAAGALHLALD